MRAAPPQTDENGKLPLHVKLIYGMPRFTIRASYIIISVYANLFYINLGAKLSTMAFFIAAGRSLDVVTDPLMGWWSDSCRSKYGRRKPFLVPGLVLYNVFYIMFWSPPAGLSPDAVTNWFGLFYVLFFVVDTFTSVPYYALGVELTDSYEERNSVYFWQNLSAACGTLFGMVVPGALMFVIASETTIFSITASSFSAMHATGMILIIMFVKERPLFQTIGPENKPEEFVGVQGKAVDGSGGQMMQAVAGEAAVDEAAKAAEEEPADKDTPGVPMASPFVVNIRRVLLNPAFRPLLYSWLFDWTSLGLLTAVFPFWVQYVLIKPDGVDPTSANTAVRYLAICSGALFVSAVCAMPFWLWLASRVGKRKAWLIYNVANSVTCPWFFAIGEGNVMGAALISALNGFAVGGQFFVDSVTADVVDYDEFLNGSRIEASFVTLATFVPKIVLVFSTALPLSLIAAAGFRNSVGMSCDELEAIGYEEAAECLASKCSPSNMDACPKAPQPQPELVIAIVRVLFCAGPALLTMIGCWIKLYFPIRTAAQMAQVQEGIVAHEEGTPTLDPICPKSHGIVQVWEGIKGRPLRPAEQKHVWRLEHFSRPAVRSLMVSIYGEGSLGGGGGSTADETALRDMSGANSVKTSTPLYSTTTTHMLLSVL
jgi:Na+/melibiose symporter-like transporter